MTLPVCGWTPSTQRLKAGGWLSVLRMRANRVSSLTSVVIVATCALLNLTLIAEPKFFGTCIDDDFKTEVAKEKRFVYLSMDFDTVGVMGQVH